VRGLLGVERIYYFGDSENDLPAFQEADVKILVLNPYNKHLVSVLNFDHVVEYGSLARWLRIEFNS
jgi:hydroxymethylpyrimidine pyrophosphatase-like HAD family hydrolase